MQYQRFIEVSQAPDEATFFKRLVEFGEELGFGLAGAIARLDKPGEESRHYMVNNAPPAFSEATRNVASSRRDPVLTKLKRLSVPFIYDQSVYTDDGSGDLWEEQAAHGYKTGIAVALHLPGGKHFMLGFDRDQPLPTVDDELTRMLAALQLMAVHAQDAAFRLLCPPNEAELPRLTPREREVLQWAARGKSNPEIAQILGISEHTVVFHSRGLMVKLGANTKHHAILNAMSLGIV